MRFEHNTIQKKGNIDFKAIHDSEVEMIKRVMAAKAEAERKGEVVYKPL
ncbi:TPA: hypothetical protein QHU55_002541 [Klebsiella aerogenes]|nr:hypothetical protein [Klebsiella aerogenes]HDS6533989.1 hypothetical protein [Klebsiella aerogenes]HDS7500251.1 hypothetical protein [Klebsiella aerogenes]HDS9641901.1 hypothetical protein [Klebsiella aerogenes]HDT0788031.1 hypothetical protein [Klebsiella aerogenes]